MAINHKKIISIDPRIKLELADKLPEPARAMLKEEPDKMDLDTFIDHIGIYEKMLKKLRSTREKAVSAFGLPLNLLLIISSAMMALSMLISSNYALPFILVALKWILIPLALASFSFALSHGITVYRTPLSLAKITLKKLGLALSGETSKPIEPGLDSCKFSKLCLGETNQAIKRNLVKHTSLDRADRSFDYTHVFGSKSQISEADTEGNTSEQENKCRPEWQLDSVQLL